MTPLKLFGYVVVALLVLNVVLFSFRVIGAGVFWVVLGVGGLCAYVVVPRRKK